jgi:hypothetical protein
MRFKMSLVELCVILVILGVWLALLIPAGDFDLTHRFPPTVSSSGDDLSNIAGEYYQGTIRGRSLRLSILPDGRYSFIWSGCTGVYCRESGYVRRTDSHYLLSPKEPAAARIEHTFLLVRWQSRRYLVPPEKMHDFCDAVIKGDEPRNEVPGDFYLSVPLNRANGIPDLPERWVNYLGEHLRIGKITEVTEGGRARVDLGTAKGIHKGSVLTVQGSSRYHHRNLRVVSVEEDSCLAEESFPGQFDQPLETGWGVVTREGE